MYMYMLYNNISYLPILCWAQCIACPASDHRVPKPSKPSARDHLVWLV